MCKVICIDLSKYNRIEIVQIAEKAGLSSMVSTLQEMKVNGYARVYFEPGLGKLYFYTLLNSKKNIIVGDCVKELLNESKHDSQNVGFSSHKICQLSSAGETESKHCLDYIRLLSSVLDDSFTENEYNIEVDRILEEINLKSIDGLTISEKLFLKSISK